MSDGGVSAAIRVNGELRATAADLPADAVFPIYSITKTLTAICILRLTDMGSLQLSDTVRRWLPEVDVPSAVTLKHLIRHTGGLRDYGPLPEYHQAVRTSPGRPWTRQQFLDAVLPAGPLFAPDESFSYSNVGYMLLINALERATGGTFARAIDDFVVKPLGLRRTVVLEEIDDLRQCVPGFGPEVTADGAVVDVRGRYHPGWCAPRVVASTAEEVTRVYDALLAGEILAADTLGQMLTMTPLSNAPDEPHSGGMGLYCDGASPWGRNYHHGGGGPGYSLRATIYPDTKLGRVSIAVFVNSSCGRRPDDREAMFLTQLFDKPL